MSELGQIIDELYAVVLDRRDNPQDGSYTNYLLDKGVDKICKKIGEESVEVVIAAKNGSKGELTYEIADLLYHLTVLMGTENITPDDVYQELRQRRR